MKADTPKNRGFRFPAEWEPHRATWLSWPHNQDSWPGKIETIYGPYCQFVKEVAQGELISINVADARMEDLARQKLELAGVPMERIEFYHFPTNDAWCRDHGPAFVVNHRTNEKAIINWGYNAWGGKYPPFDLDNEIPRKIAEKLDLKYWTPGIVMEGGSVDFNGAGTVLTTTSCLLNKNRNPHLAQKEIEQFLMDYYGMEQVLWLGDGIIGDDTDGHIDDITRFVNEDTVVTVTEKNTADNNYKPLQENLEKLNSFRLIDGRALNVVELPMPRPVIHDGQRLPASYANFYISNACVAVPTYRDPENDAAALEILSQFFTDRKVIGIDSTDLVWGLGSFHCLSQQQPAVPY